MLGRRIPARQHPPTFLSELRRALLDEWCNILQDQIDNLILSMPRRCKTWTVYDKQESLFEHRVGGYPLHLRPSQRKWTCCCSVAIQVVEIVNDAYGPDSAAQPIKCNFGFVDSVQKRPQLAIRRSVAFHLGNARPQTSKVTRQKLQKLGWEVLMHPHTVLAQHQSDIAPRWSLAGFLAKFSPIDREGHQHSLVNVVPFPIIFQTCSIVEGSGDLAGQRSV
ncbi:hypothetical protein TNCV_1129201 [Trichonephila clavipes]|nr:hypothetical protein TNCV_1129201 [Trichonephila clavipes]